MISFKCWHTIKVCVFRRCASSSQRYLHSTSGGSTLHIQDIKERLSSFPGGSVSLTFTGKDESLAVINVSHPQRKNAFSGTMCVSLYEIVKELSEDEARKAVILRGLGGMFCSGADLSMAKQIADPVNGEMFSYFMQTTLSNLRALPFPSYAVAQGKVLGGGTELLLACDLALATPDTSIQFVQGRLGISPGWAGATHLVRKVGYHKALDILLSTKRLSSVYASSIGLIDHMIPSTDNDTRQHEPLTDEQLLTQSVEIIGKQVDRLAVEVVRGLKSVVINASNLPYSESIAHERKVFKSLWGAEANLEAFKQNLKHS